MVMGKTYKNPNGKPKWKPKGNKNQVKKALNSAVRRSVRSQAIYDDIDEVEDNFEKFDRKR